MRTHAATRLLALILSLQYVARIQFAFVRPIAATKFCRGDNDFHMSHEKICCSNRSRRRAPAICRIVCLGLQAFHTIDAMPFFFFATSVVETFFFFLESVRRKLREEVKWRSLNKLNPRRTSLGRRAAAKAEVALKVTAVRVKVAVTTVAVRRSLDPITVAPVTTSQDDSELTQYLFVGQRRSNGLYSPNDINLRK